MNNNSIVNFQEKQLIGSGTFGNVYKASHPIDGRTYAIKVIAISDQDKDSIPKAVNEVRLLASLEHPNIVRYFGSFISAQNELCIQMEYCKSTLEELLKSNEIDFTKKINIMFQIAHGVSYLHNLNIIHRDLKPANILIRANNIVRISDFGISSLDYNISCFDSYGTYIYTDPQIYNHKRLPDKYGDIYSLGIILTEMLLSFKTQMERAAVLGNITNSKDWENTIHPFAFKTISCCTDKDLTKRPTANDLVLTFNNAEHITASLEDIKTITT